MATKRSKKAKRSAASSSANATGSRASKSGSTAEPFFRPFMKLKAPKKAAKPQAAAGAAPASGATEPAAKTTAKTAAATRKMEARPTPADNPTSTSVKPVDPETFAIFMAGVRVLDQQKSRIPKNASRIERAVPNAPPPGDLDAPARASMRSLVTEGLRFESIDDGGRLEGRRLDVDPREVRRLRRGQYAIDGKLDLHGMSLEQARDAVSAFVRKRSLDGDRVIQIIHGKGEHSPRGLAVLRGEIGAWLSDGRAARHVAAFATAPDDMGGEGALLVLLAR